MKRRLVLAVAMLALVPLAVPAGADETIFMGLDLWYTPNNGAQVTVDVPAGLFCGGTSNPIPGLTVNLKGRRLATNPANALGATDTVVDRPFDAGFAGGLQTSTQLKIRALSLVSVNSFSIYCSSSGVTEVYDVEVSLNGPQTFGTIVIRRPAVGAPGGDFDASFQVRGKVVFINAANRTRTAPLPDTVTITTLNACWTHAPAAGSVVWNGPVTIDTNGDQVPDYNSPYGTSNFFAGGCGTPVDHEGPHPTTCNAPGPDCPNPEPPDPCTKEVTEYLRAHQAEDGFLLDSAQKLNQMFSTTPDTAAPAVTEEYIGSVRVDRCIQHSGSEILQGKI